MKALFIVIALALLVSIPTKAQVRVGTFGITAPADTVSSDSLKIYHQTLNPKYLFHWVKGTAKWDSIPYSGTNAASMFYLVHASTDTLTTGKNIVVAVNGVANTVTLVVRIGTKYFTK